MFPYLARWRGESPCRTMLTSPSGWERACPPAVLITFGRGSNSEKGYKLGLGAQWIWWKSLRRSCGCRKLLKGIDCVPSSRPRERLLDIIENAERIASYILNLNENTFVQNHLICDAVERCLERICEAVVKLGDQAEALLPGQPAAKIKALGNLLRHEYDGIHRPLLWKIVHSDVPAILDAARQGQRRLG